MASQNGSRNTRQKGVSSPLLQQPKHKEKAVSSPGRQEQNHKAVAYRRTSLAGEGDGAGGDGAGLNKPAAVVSTDGRAPSEDPAGVDAGH